MKYVKVITPDNIPAYGKITVQFSGPTFSPSDWTAGIKILSGKYKGWTLPFRKSEVKFF